jgi:hypothetical protein
VVVARLLLDERIEYVLFGAVEAVDERLQFRELTCDTVWGMEAVVLETGKESRLVGAMCERVEVSVRDGSVVVRRKRRRCKCRVCADVEERGGNGWWAALLLVSEVVEEVSWAMASEARVRRRAVSCILRIRWL